MTRGRREHERIPRDYLALHVADLRFEGKERGIQRSVPDPAHQICVQSHEKAVLDAGLTEDMVHDAVRIAAVIHAVAVALESAGVAATA